MNSANLWPLLLRPIVGLVLGAVPLACDEDPEFFHHCPMSRSIIAVCEEDQPDTELTCVVKEHPMCEEQVCAAWEGSDSFCSRLCASDGECPAESRCLQHLDYSLCVPNELPPVPGTTVSP